VLHNGDVNNHTDDFSKCSDGEDECSQVHPRLICVETIKLCVVFELALVDTFYPHSFFLHAQIVRSWPVCIFLIVVFQLLFRTFEVYLFTGKNMFQNNEYLLFQDITPFSGKEH